MNVGWLMILGDYTNQYIGEFIVGCKHLYLHGMQPKRDLLKSPLLLQVQWLKTLK